MRGEKARLVTGQVHHHNDALISHHSMMLDSARFSRLPTISRQARVVPDPNLGGSLRKIRMKVKTASVKHHHERCNRIQERVLHNLSKFWTRKSPGVRPNHKSRLAIP